MNWGPVRMRDGRWQFRLWAPTVTKLTLELAGREPAAMADRGGGWFAVTVEARPGDRYRFRVSKERAVPDPASRAQAGDVHGWSVVVDPDSYGWRTDGWRGRPWEQAAIQELHVGLLGGFAGVARELPRLSALGITAVELMPVADFPGRRNWGYDGVLPYAPASAYGTPDELKALVDRAHELGLMVLLDVVYNHFGPEGSHLASYAPEFFHPEVATPWGAAIAFDEEPVRQFFLDNALMWLNEYRFDGLRLDAVHSIKDETFVDVLRQTVREKVGSGRHVHLVLENEHNDAGLLQDGYDAQWNDDFHNTGHVLLTGETDGYYADFAERPAEKLARCLAEGFVYQGDTSPGSGKPRGTRSGELPMSCFVAFLQNHDQVGNRACGERLTVLTSSDRLRAATALLLLCPQVPLIFMGDETGSRSPFLFFTDFEDGLADAVREGRRAEFARFPAFADAAARAKIPDPNDPATFERSRPEPGPDAGEWMQLYRDLLALRARTIAPRLAGARGIGAEAIGGGAVLARWRLADDAVLTLFVNLGAASVDPPELPDSEPIFALGGNGAPGSFGAWLGNE
ncbi:MAG TPA: malto-oligosyltrehalose trehalohydrolase [Woeseiaceae bacterium]|nr:malto-oligosyltrehalose trehalohydrolase [Woeseiaceae bacterium]